MQKMPYEEQLKLKHDNLVKALGKVCRAEKIGQVQGLIYPFGYRTRLLMPAATSPRKNPPFDLGFYARGSTQLTDAAGCPVQHPLTLATLALVRQALMDTAVEATASRSRHGWLHGIAIRVDPPSGKSEVTLVGKTGKIPNGKHLGHRLAMLPGVNGVHISVNPDRSSYLLGEQYVQIGGNRRTAFHLGGQEFNISPGSFFQTCAEAAEMLVGQVLDALPKKIQCLADLYGGVGVFARLSREKWQRAIVAESNPHAIEDLRTFLSGPNRIPIKVLAGRVESVIGDVLKARPDAVILDPPRSGCNPKVIGSLVHTVPSTIVYVSCGLEALVRDSESLRKFGYRIDRVTSVDMFPHTEHLEVVVRFVR
jgi:23S rRNA (uracil-5-)-methyltransferase RumA